MSKVKKDLELSIDMVRMWINQPSTLQPDHKLHGQEVLASFPSDRDGFIRVYPNSGALIATSVHKSILESGWKY